MRFEVGKTYYRVKDDFGIHEFYIDKMTRHISTQAYCGNKYLDIYFWDNKQVIVDDGLNDAKLNRIFGSKKDAINFVIRELEQFDEGI